MNRGKLNLKEKKREIQSRQDRSIMLAWVANHDDVATNLSVNTDTSEVLVS